MTTVFNDVGNVGDSSKNRPTEVAGRDPRPEQVEDEWEVSVENSMNGEHRPPFQEANLKREGGQGRTQDQEKCSPLSIFIFTF